MMGLCTVLEIEMGAHLQNISDRLGRAQNVIEARTVHMDCPAKRRLPCASSKRLVLEVYESSQDPQSTNKNLYMPTAKP